jgi:uridine phosphorylase
VGITSVLRIDTMGGFSSEASLRLGDSIVSRYT